jgi:nucleoid DNA-binding protein
MTEFNLSEIITHVAEKATINKKVVKEVLQEAILIIAETLPKAEKSRVEIDGFGVFKLVKHQEKKWQLAGKSGVTPAHFTVEFAPAPKFLDAANANFANLDGLLITK